MSYKDRVIEKIEQYQGWTTLSSLTTPDGCREFHELMDEVLAILESSKTAKVNLNDKVKVMLTVDGVKAHIDHFNLINIQKMIEAIPPKACIPEIDDAGYTTIQLWQLIEIFASHISMTSRAVFKDNNIFLDIDCP